MLRKFWAHILFWSKYRKYLQTKIFASITRIFGLDKPSSNKMHYKMNIEGKYMLFVLERTNPHSFISIKRRKIMRLLRMHYKFCFHIFFCSHFFGTVNHQLYKLNCFRFSMLLSLKYAYSVLIKQILVW